MYVLEEGTCSDFLPLSSSPNEVICGGWLDVNPLVQMPCPQMSITLCDQFLDDLFSFSRNSFLQKKIDCGMEYKPYTCNDIPEQPHTVHTYCVQSVINYALKACQNIIITIVIIISTSSSSFLHNFFTESFSNLMYHNLKLGEKMLIK